MKIRYYPPSPPTSSYVLQMDSLCNKEMKFHFCYLQTLRYHDLVIILAPHFVKLATLMDKLTYAQLYQTDNLQRDRFDQYVIW